MTDERPVCVVGAGCSGLAAAHALAERDLPFVVHEAREGIGGNWRYDPGPGRSACYRSLETNTSRWRTSFRAMPMQRRGPAFLSHQEMLGYLESFADRFGLRDQIRFNSAVRAARPVDGGWEVNSTSEGRQLHRALVIATGVDREPRIPTWPGQFDGLVLHSRDYRTPEPFGDRDVVIVGTGSSGVDLAAEIAAVARSITIARRSPRTISARRLGRFPLDLFDTELGTRIPWSVRRRLIRALMRLATGSQAAAGFPCPQRLGDTRIALNDEIVKLARQGRIRVAPPLVALHGDEVVFADGQRQPAQALLLATGYSPTVDFLPPGVDSPLPERIAPYRGIVPPGTPNLFFVGFLEGHRAGIPAVEAQASWIAAVIAGDLALPDTETMRASVAADHAIRERAFGPRHGLMFDIGPYARALRRESRGARRRPGLARRAAKPTVVVR